MDVTSLRAATQHVINGYEHIFLFAHVLAGECVMTLWLVVSPKLYYSKLTHYKH